MGEWRQNLETELARVRQEIETHKLALVDLRKYRKTLERKIYDPITGEERNGQDTSYVLASELRPFIKTWVDLYNKQHGGSGAMRTLSEMSNVSTRVLRGIKNGGRAYNRLSTLETADRVLRAMGMGYRIHDLTIVERDASVRAEIPQPPFHHFEEE